MRRVAFVAVLSIGMAFLASGCLWGFVRDVDTGAGVEDAIVKWTDFKGRSHSTMTDSDGLYVFDHASGPVPRTGYVDFEVWKEKGACPKVEEQRVVRYDDRVSAVDPFDRWEIQNFSIWCTPAPSTPTPRGYREPPAETPTPMRIRRVQATETPVVIR